MIAKRVYLFVATLLFAASAAAVTVAERSPFAQGHWWDPARSGSGFDMFSVGEQMMVIWYTYDSVGKPVWYTAQGSLADLGRRDWGLMKHRWADGRKAEALEVGTLRVTLRHAESAEVAWTIGEMRGAWSIRPFVVSGVIPEVDHSGSWFDPANSGWGMTLTEQGEVLGGVLYTYDPAGSPTWAAGFGRERGRVELHAFAGACPWCTYRAPSSTSVGRVGLDFPQEGELVLRSDTLAMPMAAGVNTNNARMFQLSLRASQRAADRQLASFSSRASLKAFLDTGMLNVRPASSGADFSAAPPSAATFSPTNLIEGGVDEASLVKSDGRYVYTYAHGSLGRLSAIRIAEVGADGTSIAVRGSRNLASGPETPLQFAGLFLHGGQLVSVTGTQPAMYTFMASSAWTRGRAHVEVLSLAAPDSPVTRWRAEIEGHVVATRRVGDRLYVVSRFVPFLEGFLYGTSYPPHVAANQHQLANTPLAAMMPKVRIDGGAAVEALDVSAVFAPPQASTPPVGELTIVTAIDLAEPRISQSLAIAGSVEAVYASTTNLYVASSRHVYRSSLGPLLAVEPSNPLTDIHQIRLGETSLSVVASASIEGFLGSDVDQLAFRMSEHQGRLRVVSGSNAWGWAQNNRNRLTVLEPSTITPGLLRTVAYLPNAQRPQALGKPNELLYGTRFLGDRLYAVTFRMTDPLYVVDLMNPADPRIAGELEIPGFSEYLHPLPNGRLLGFGKDATATGLFQGLQLSLYDVSDASRPRELQKVIMGRRGSDSALLKHHHAFSALQQADGSISFAIPARIHDGVPQGTGDGAFYPWQQSGLMRFEIRPTAGAPMVQLAPLVTHHVSMPSQGLPGGEDAAANGGRSILFGGGTVYIGNGRFWRQDPAGNTFGPF